MFTTSAPCVTFSWSLPAADTPSAGLSTLVLTVMDGTLPAGVNTISFSGALMGAAQASTSTFMVTTSQEVCGNSIASGSISNSNPGANTSSAVSLMLSVAAALFSAVLLCL